MSKTDKLLAAYRKADKAALKAWDSGDIKLMRKANAKRLQAFKAWAKVAG